MAHAVSFETVISSCCKRNGGVSGYEVTPSKPLVYSVPVEDGVPWGIR